MTRLPRDILLLIAGVCVASPAVLWGQEEDDADEEEAMEEIVVVVDRDGDPVDVNALYLEQLRTRVIKDFEMAQLESGREDWRMSLQTSVSVPDSRISWGYDARSEAAMRRSIATDLPMDGVRPATVISIRF